MHLPRLRPLTALVVLTTLATLLATATSALARAKPTLVPSSRLPGAGAFEGPVRTVPVDGIKLGYRQFGHGPELLMVTGDTAPMSLWMPYQLRPLAQRFHVTIFDNRGVGYSSDDAAVKLTVPLMAKDTDGLIRALGLKGATIAGWSMGGEIGITMAERYPHAFARLVTSGGDAGSRHTVPPPPGLIRKLNGGSTTAALKLLFPATAAGRTAEERFIKGYVTVPQETLSKAILARQARAENAFLRYPDVWNALDTIRLPVLVTNGALDPGVPVVNARNLHREIPGSTLRVFAGASHGMMFQDAAEFARLVARFAQAG